ncbi:transglutaminase family protein [Tsuneonella sp. CC-YZS046]|uniref:transglutaminase family protein n=1 Tax=Tsuneonella sp. CC-YZS046 TaxID=3042152 RepID=UPI002D777BE1|nr:transglutaminase family protein [Tsuneonella sp. CC-YZS046]WRO67303.1 transglutaminase family protein [Tsuneonella sp. CC-YZS046]
MRLAVRHTTRYRFRSPVAHGLQRLRLTPKETQGQRVVDWRMSFEGAKEELSYDDQNCNHVTLVSILPGTLDFVIHCEGTVETSDQVGVIGRHAGHMPLWAFVNQTALTRPGPRMRAILSSVTVDRENPIGTLHGLSAAILNSVGYETGHTHVGTSAEEAAALGRGVCQDHSQIFIGLVRMLGIPARYVSGYLMMDDRVGQEATHAWAEACIDGLGWVGFDISNGISPDARYVRIATGRDYAEAAPVNGITFGGAEQSLHIEIAVEQQSVEQ